MFSNKNFNPRSHERSDGNNMAMMLVDGVISIHAPTRGATLFHVLFPCILLFQSTLPREERRYHLFSQFLYSQFQSTLPREERRSVPVPDSGTQLFQSTLPREERLQRLCCVYFLENFNPRSHERSDKFGTLIKFVLS